jgi:hypothetical protein
MTVRERNMALGLGAVVLLAGVGYGAYWVYDNVIAGRAAIDELRRKVDEKQAKINAINNQKFQIDRWRRLSLPADTSTARSEYNQYLRDLMSSTGMLEQSISADKGEFKSPITHPTKPGKQPIYTGLVFDVDARASMRTLVAFLSKFQSSPRMHRIKKLTIERSETQAGVPKGPAAKGGKGGKGGKSFGDPRDDTPDLNVKITIEALIILDSEPLQKQNKVPDRRTMALEVASALRGLPIGVVLAAWSVGPTGPVVGPINPPLPARQRDYRKMEDKNIFRGAQRWSPPTPPPAEKLIEEDFNLMKYTRYFQLSNEVGRRGQILSSEARLWDFADRPKLGFGILALRDSVGTDRIPMLRSRPAGNHISTGGVLVYAHALKLDGEMLIQVKLNFSDPKQNRWWRYPMDDNFYRLHQDDIDALLKRKVIKPEEAGQLFLVSEPYWAKMIEDNRVKMLKGSKTRFEFAGSVHTSEIIDSDPNVRILKLPGTTWPPKPPRTLEGLTVGVDRLYPNADTIYNISKKHLDMLIANKVSVKPEDIDRVFVIHAAYYDELVADRLIVPNAGAFTFFHHLLRGDILHTDNDVVVLRLAEKYCECVHDDTEVNGKTVPGKKHWHEGYCLLHIGQTVEDALKVAVTPDEAKNILNPPAATPPTSTPPPVVSSEADQGSSRRVGLGRMRRAERAVPINEGD